MPLPEKLFFELGECAERWHITMGDVQYYVTHGYLEAQAWVPFTDVEFCRVDGETGQVRSFIVEHQGYAALFPETCRRIFSQLGCIVSGFHIAGSEDFFKLPQGGLMVRPDDLRISREELQRFEQAYDLVSTPASPSRAGRPSVMDKILTELQRRIETGKDMKSNNAEAEHLYRWAEATIREASHPEPSEVALAWQDALAPTRALMDRIRPMAHSIEDRQRQQHDHEQEQRERQERLKPRII